MGAEEVEEQRFLGAVGRDGARPRVVDVVVVVVAGGSGKGQAWELEMEDRREGDFSGMSGLGLAGEMMVVGRPVKVL